MSGLTIDFARGVPAGVITIVVMRLGTSGPSVVRSM
jgi:hypothetical protein